MSQRPIPPGDDEIANVIRSRPELWHHRQRPAADPALDAAVIQRAIHGAPVVRRRRRKRWVAGGLAVIVVAGGGAVATALLRSDPPQTELGATCRTAAALDADQIVLEPGSEPLAGCAVLWSSGRMQTGITDVPALVVCAGSLGAAEVFPGDITTCTELGLTLVDTTPNSKDSTVVELQERILADINGVGCQPVETAFAVAKQIVAESSLQGWQVHIEPGSESGTCSKAFVDSAAKRVVLSEL